MAAVDAICDYRRANSIAPSNILAHSHRRLFDYYYRYLIQILHLIHLSPNDAISRLVLYLGGLLLLLPELLGCHLYICIHSNLIITSDGLPATTQKDLRVEGGYHADLTGVNDHQQFGDCPVLLRSRAAMEHRHQ